MCGIFGYKGTGDSFSIVFTGLKDLEYRGYDSWGIASLTDEGIAVVKKVGKIGTWINFEGNDSRVSIGHTRWSTHGEPSYKNAHPHLSCDKKIAVVHNGIIENHEEIKSKLKDHNFKSETDTEVIAHLIEEYLKNNNYRDSVLMAARDLEGSFALMVVNNKEKKIIAVRKGSPLVLGIKNGEFFLASDLLALLKHTNEVVFMEDNEAAIFNSDLEIVNFKTNKKVNKKPIKVNIDFNESDKGEFPHFMLKEIYEQPKAIEKTINELIGGGLSFNIPEKIISKLNRIIIVACGTSWHAGLVGEYIIEKFLHIPVEVEYASEFRYRDPVIDKDTLVIAISQSGETADTNAAVKEAKKKKAFIFSICNVFGSTLTRLSDLVVYTRAGPEIGVASTKAFTTQLSVLYLFSLFLAGYNNKLTKNEIEEKIRLLKGVPKQIEHILNKAEDAKDIAKSYFRDRNALYLGRGLNFPIALEGALKLKEVSYVHAEGYPAAEMKHGPIALIDKDMPVVFIAVKDKTYEKIVANIEEVKSRKGKIIAIANEGDKVIKNKVDHVLYVPKADDFILPFLTVVPLQLLAYYIADLRGCDIDKPRNLAKSVTVE